MIDTYPEESKERILSCISRIAPSLEKLPGVCIIHDIRDGSVIYMTQSGLKMLGVTLEEIKSMGTDYYKRFFNQADADYYVPQMLEMVARNNPLETFTFFQQVRRAENAEWEWYLSSIRILEQDDDGKAIATITIAHHITPERHYTTKVDRLLEELTFIRNNVKTIALLGKRELDILRLLASGYKSSEIADTLFISVLTVDTHRKNIRKKLGIKTQIDLDRYARAFDLK